MPLIVHHVDVDQDIALLITLQHAAVLDGEHHVPALREPARLVLHRQPAQVARGVGGGARLTRVGRHQVTDPELGVQVIQQRRLGSGVKVTSAASGQVTAESPTNS